jgi:galactokinase
LEILPHGLAFNAVITSNIPMGYGLGSSAALEVAMATFLERLCGTEQSGGGIPKALRCHEADVTLGYKYRGIADHFLSTLATPGDLLLIDCQSKDYQVTHRRPSPLIA